MAHIRLYVTQELYNNQVLVLSAAQGHYLIRVMRLSPGDTLSLFNGKNGEWQGSVEQANAKDCRVHIGQQLRPQVNEPDIWLCFAPIKHDPIHYLVQKTTELGVAVLQPVQTQRTVVHRINLTRLQENCTEAAEQSCRLTVPKVQELVTLDQLLQHWDKDRLLLYCNEMGQGTPLFQALRALPANQPVALLVGPEGGFTPTEFKKLSSLPYVVPITLGSRILRADTAGIAALACYMSIAGDWNTPLTGSNSL